MTHRIFSLWFVLVLGACSSATPAPDAAPASSPLPPSEAAPSAPPPQDQPASLGPPAGVDGTRRVAAPEASASPASTSPAELPRGTRILHIGDSMAGALGIALNRQLEAKGVEGKLRYETASFIPTWAWSKKLPVYLAQQDPDLVLISLGTNELQIQDPERRAKTIQHLVGRLEGRPCVWIAPPYLEAGDNGLRQIIHDNCAPCGYMNTDEVYEDMPRVSDKIHPTMAAREEWARRVITWLAEHRQPAAERPWELSAEVVPAAPLAQ